MAKVIGGSVTEIEVIVECDCGYEFRDFVELRNVVEISKWRELSSFSVYCPDCDKEIPIELVFNGSELEVIE